MMEMIGQVKNSSSKRSFKTKSKNAGGSSGFVMGTLAVAALAAGTFFAVKHLSKK